MHFFVNASAKDLKLPPREMVKYDHWLNETLFSLLFLTMHRVLLNYYFHKLNMIGDITMGIESLAQSLKYICFT